MGAGTSRRKETEGRAVRFDSGRLSGRPPKARAQPPRGPRHVRRLRRRHRRRAGRRSGRKYVCTRTGSGARRARTAPRIAAEACTRPCPGHRGARADARRDRAGNPADERDDVRDAQRQAGARAGKDVEKRIERLVEAIETGGEAALTRREGPRAGGPAEAIAPRWRASGRCPRLAPAVIESRLAEWRRLLRQSPTQGRAVLQRVRHGAASPSRRARTAGYDFTAPRASTGCSPAWRRQRPAWIAERATAPGPSTSARRTRSTRTTAGCWSARRPPRDC